MIRKMIGDLQAYQADCVDAFRIMCSPSDVDTNPEAKKLAKKLNRQGKIIDKIVRLLIKLDG